MKLRTEIVVTWKGGGSSSFLSMERECADEPNELLDQINEMIELYFKGELKTMTLDVEVAPGRRTHIRMDEVRTITAALFADGEPVGGIK